MFVSLYWTIITVESSWAKLVIRKGHVETNCCHYGYCDEKCEAEKAGLVCGWHVSGAVP